MPFFILLLSSGTAFFSSFVYYSFQFCANPIQSAISALTDYSQQYISRHWQLLLSLIGLSNSKSGKNPDHVGEGVMASLGGYLEEGMGQAETPEAVLKRVGTVFFDWMEPDQWRSFWPLLSRRSQLQVLSALMTTLPNLDRLH